MQKSVQAEMESLFKKSTPAVAQELLGWNLVHDVPEGRVIGRIVETEAYLSKNDRASHSANGKNGKNSAMFGPPGYVYLYKFIGIWICFNIVTSEEGVGEAVLIRALQPIAGIPDHKLTNGPGKLALAMGVRLEQNHSNLLSGGMLRLERPTLPIHEKIEIGTRIGITKDADLPLRFYLEGNPYVSDYKKRDSGSRAEKSSRAKSRISLSK